MLNVFLPEEILGNFRDEPHQQRAGGLQTGVGVDLDQPWFVVLVDHEIEAEKLEMYDKYQVMKKHTSNEFCLFFGSILPYTDFTAWVARTFMFSRSFSWKSTLFDSQNFKNSMKEILLPFSNLP